MAPGLGFTWEGEGCFEKAITFSKCLYTIYMHATTTIKPLDSVYHSPLPVITETRPPSRVAWFPLLYNAV